MDVSSRRNCAKETGTGFSTNSSVSSSSSSSGEGGRPPARRVRLPVIVGGLTLAIRGTLILDTRRGAGGSFLGRHGDSMSSRERSLKLYRLERERRNGCGWMRKTESC